ncbi:MAG: tyrosine--tRNA ligase [Candidatus Cloacimonetes bacterium]|nr:tyrosine--tRNA ligase [Candidatus Cloacimonadota bacterium]HPM01447.1 tyrosine--tRNA ligase [Candidatus Cloacimonadota bacterium]
MKNLDEQLKMIKKGVEEIIPQDELIKKIEKSIKTGKPLRIKYGIDPTGYDVHIGHLVPIRKMREFQDLGHTGVIIIGDYTAQIGDPTGRDESRPPLTQEQVKKNSEKYMEQLFTVLDREKTEIRYQSEWFGNLGLMDVIKLLSKFTLAQFMAHDTFRKRWESGNPLFMHEIMYPLLQGYDSVAIEADIELGATEQKFNILSGRDMQKFYNMDQQVAILSPILLGTCGTRKMGKSFNNYIAVFDTPSDKYGKVMSIPDNLILNYFNYATKVDPDEINKIKDDIDSGANPKYIKQRLAREIVSLYHGEEIAQNAENEFNKIFSQKEIPTDIETLILTEMPVWIIKLLTDSKLCTSSSEARRMIKQGAVSLNNEKITDENLQLEISEEVVIKVGKRKFLKLIKG